MHGNQPAEIVVEPLSFTDVRYVLPVRQHALVRQIGWLLLLLGGGVLLVPIAWCVSLIIQLLRTGHVDLGGACFYLFMAPIFLGAQRMASLGACLVFGHHEIELLDGTLRATERASFCRHRWSRPWSEITQVTVIGGIGEQASHRMLTGLSAIRAGNNRGCIWLALGYPSSLCQSLADDLARRLTATAPIPVVLREPEPMVSLTKLQELVQPKTTRPVQRREQPLNSQVVVERLPDGITLNVPATGLRGGSMALFVMGAFWSGLLTLIGLAGTISNGLPEWPSFVIFVVLDLIGVGLVLLGLNHSRRRAGLAVVDGQLMILQTGFPKLERQWEAHQIRSICVGPSGAEVNDEPVLELQIIGTDGRKCGLLGGRNVSELEWIATTLRDALAPTATEPESGF